MMRCDARFGDSFIMHPFADEKVAASNSARRTEACRVNARRHSMKAAGPRLQSAS
jgi:hypothetical protein